MCSRASASKNQSYSFGSDDGDMAGDLEQAIAGDAMVMLQRLVEIGVVAFDGEILRGTALGAWTAMQLLDEDGFEVTIVD